MHQHWTGNECPHGESALMRGSWLDASWLNANCQMESWVCFEIFAIFFRFPRLLTCWSAGMWRVRPLRPFRSTWPGSLTTCGQSAHVSINPKPHGFSLIWLFWFTGWGWTAWKCRYTLLFICCFVALAAHDLKLLKNVITSDTSSVIQNVNKLPFCVQGTNGSQLWDTCFAVQAFLEVETSNYISMFIFQRV